tara:strand:+ start:655 stop:1146 length:492 start_codon:yes stop_codon:yes gene_type:complete
MKKMLLLLLLVLLSGCAVNQVDIDVYNNDWYSIDVPEGWIVAEAEEGRIVSLLSDGEEFVNIIIEVEETNLGLGQVWLEEKERLERSELMVGTQQLQETTTTLDTEIAYSVTYEYFLGEALKAEEIVAVHSGNSFIVTLQSAEGVFNSEYATFEASLNSFEFN